MGGALVALAVAVGAFLRTSSGNPTPSAPTPILSSLDWQSAAGGWVTLTNRQTHLSVLFHTANGGHHWDRQFATVGELVRVHFLDSNRGLIEERPAPSARPIVLRSGDGGVHWSPIPMPDEADRRPSATFFLDFDHGWVLLTNDRGPLAQDVTLYRTENGGLNWTESVRVDVGHPLSHGMTESGLKSGPWFRTALDGWIGNQEPDGSAALYVTHDGGREWRGVPLPEPPGGWNVGDAVQLLQPGVSGDGRGALAVVDTNRLNAVMHNRSLSQSMPAPVTVYASQDGGGSWHEPRPAPVGTDPHLGASIFGDGYTGWLAGGQTLWLTSDSGRTWMRQGQLPAGWFFAGLAPVDASVAVAQAAAGPPPILGDFRWQLLITEDGGRTWREVPAPQFS